MAALRCALLSLVGLMLLRAEGAAGQVTIGFDAPIYSVTEGMGGMGDATVTLTVMSGNITVGEVVVTVTTQDGSAVSASDYQNTTMDLTFSSVSGNSMSVTIAIIDNGPSEDTESFMVNVAMNEAGTTFNETVTLSPSSAEVVIQDDDTVTIGFDPAAYSVVEGETVSVCVSLTTGALERNITVAISLAGSGGAGSTDIGALGDITFGPDDMVSDPKCITVTATVDGVLEPEEALMLALGSADERVLFSPSMANVTISMATVSMVDYPSVTVEESVGAYNACISISPTPMINVSVLLSIMDGTATAGSDYEAVTVMEVFTSGVSMLCVSVPIMNDDAVEASENFTISVTAIADNVMVTNGIVEVTIAEDPADMVTVAVPETMVAEEGDGTVDVCVDLMALVSVERDVEVTVETRNGTALANLDFTPVDMVLTFSSPAGSAQECVPITLLLDGALEDEETFEVVVSSEDPAVVIINAITIVTISANGAATIGFAPNSVSVTVDDGGSVELSTVLMGSREINVAFNVTISPDDFSSILSSMAFEFTDSDQFNFTLMIPASLDLTMDQNLTLTISTLDSRITVSPSVAMVTIIVFVVSLEETVYSVVEGAPVEVCAVLVSTRTATDGMVQLMTMPGSAMAGTDYIPISTPLTLTLGPNILRACVNISTVNDNDYQGNLDFSVTLTPIDPEIVTISTNSSLITIMENDALTIGFSTGAAVMVMEGMNTTLEFGVLNGTLRTEIAVVVATQDGSGGATAGADYVSVDMVLTLSEATPMGSVVIATLTDMVTNESTADSSEMFSVILTQQTPSPLISIDPGTTTVTIIDTPFISRQPEDAFVLLGGTAMFSVEAFGFNISYQWLFDGMDLVEDPGNIDGVTTNTLTITNVTDANIGNYSCRVENLLTNVSSSAAQLLFLNPPVIETFTGDVGVEEGTDITLVCTATSPDGAVNITWSTNNTALMPLLTPVMLTTAPDGTLESTITLMGVNVDASGQLTCTATNRFSAVQRTLSLFVITIFGVEDEEVITGADATLFCNATGHPNLTYAWGRASNMAFSVDTFLNSSMGRVEGADTNMLTIRNVGNVDAMGYGCNISLFGDLVGAAFGDLTAVGPMVITDPVGTTVTTNDTLRLNCTAVNNEGAPNPLMFRWVFDGTFLPNSSVVNTPPDENNTVTSTLTVPSVTRADAGGYQCLAFNRDVVDEDRSEVVTVTVNFVPVVLLTLDGEETPVFTLTNGQNAIVRCSAEAVPGLTSLEVVAISPEGVRETLDFSNITVEPLNITVSPTLEQSGTVYECVAINSIGRNTTRATVTVQDVPAMVNHSDISASVVDLLRVNLTWTSPPDNNAPVTLFSITSCVLNSGSVCIPGTMVTVNFTRQATPGEPITRQDMYNVDSSIRVIITAVNAVGMGPAPAVRYDFNTATPSDGTPVSPEQIVLTPDAAVYSWLTSSRGRGQDVEVQQYNVTLSPLGGTPSKVVVTMPVQPNELDTFGTGFTELDSGVMHNVSVVAVFRVPELVSDPLNFNFMTLQQGQAQTLFPGQVVADADPMSGGTRATIRWPPPDTTFLLKFVVRTLTIPRATSTRTRRQAPTRDEQEMDAPAGATSLDIVTTLFSDITVSVAAVYQPDEIPIEIEVVTPTTFSTPEGMAEAPNITLVEPFVNLTMLRVTWQLPSVPNGIITSHDVEFREMGTTAFAPRRIENPNTVYIIDMISADTTYQVRVRSRTNGGAIAGAFSELAMGTTGFGVFPPEVSVFPSSVSNSRFNLAITLRQTFGPVGFYQVVVTRSNQVNTRDVARTSPTSGDPYVAFQADATFQGVTTVQPTYELGAGSTVPHRGVVFTNAALDGDTNYYVFVRAFSSRDETIFADSVYSTVIRFANPLNTVAIIAPIAAIAIILLIILVVLLLVAYLTMRGTFRRKGYAPAGTVLLEDGKRRKGGAAMELRRTRLFSPVLNVGDPDVFTSAGQPTTLICEASGTPAPEVTWTHNGQPLDKERFIQLADGSLFINDTDLQDEGTYVVRATNMAGDVEAQVRVTVLRPIPPEPDADHTPIKVGEFSEKIALVRAEDDEGLEDEYADVELDWTFSSYTAKLNINKNKNRYINIIPYDHSRVVLSLQDNTPGSDYINASFVDAFQRPNGYIASQGPIPSTFPDFWRMIWELDSPTIVMVTNLKEEDKIKCHQYWPSYGTTTYGNIQVTLKEVENLAEYSIRTFNVSPLAGQSRVPMPVREVRQFHFLVWPDHGVPQYATNLLSFRKRVLKYHPEKRGPMAVHCSAGVGRTGTFITIDYMLKQIEAEGIIDIFNFVRHMRYRRNYMVQTSPQYVFIHDALLESIMCGDNSIKAPEMRAKVKEMQQVVPETGKTVFETQFNTLLTASPPDDDFDSSIAQLPDNMSKNRCKVHLPANDYRVVLSTDGDKADYICASYVDNYRERNAFIVTQAPMTETVADFWRMMWETKSAAIVMLTELVEGDQEMCVKYWPSGVGDPSVFGGYQVELSEDEKDRGSYITRRFKLSSLDKPQESRMVSQFHFTKWTKTTPPSDCRPMIDLIDELQRVQRKSGNMPITVHCDDGLSRTGAFCALYSVLERVKTEQIVDVFQAIKTLRIQRTGLLGTIEEYEFVHRAVIEFLDTFSDYQNFK